MRSTGNFSGGEDSQSMRSQYARFHASPSKFGSPRSKFLSPAPQVHQREISRLAHTLKLELETLKADLDYMIEQWHEEMDRLEETLGSQGLETLLDHLQKKIRSRPASCVPMPMN